MRKDIFRTMDELTSAVNFISSIDEVAGERLKDLFKEFRFARLRYKRGMCEKSDLESVYLTFKRELNSCLRLMAAYSAKNDVDSFL